MECLNYLHLNIKSNMKITINEPCHENWDNMTPNAKGAFCLNCQKNVIDFSTKSIHQIKDFFAKNVGSESVCGRFDEKQLTALSFDDFFSSFKKWQFLHKTAVIVFFVFGFALFGTAQNKPKPNPEPVHITMGAVAYVPQDSVKKINKRDTTEDFSPKMGKVRYEPKPQPVKKKTSTKKMGEVVAEEKKK